MYHSANTANPETDYLRLNSTNGTADDATFWGDTAPTSSVFSVGSAFNSGEKLLFYAWTEKSGYSKFGSYTGNGSATGPQITGLGFRPAWIMIKRTDSARDWVIIDTTRDPLGTTDKTLIANVSDAEYSNIADLDILSDGFQPKTSGVTVNASGGTYIYMAFAGGLDTIAPLNTDGDIDSRVKASDDTGFSVVRYEGTGTAGDTVGHGLSAAPDWIVTRRLDSTSNWLVYHSAITDAEDKYLSLETTNAVADNAGPWNDTAPTSSVFSVGAAAWTNTSGGDYVAYCWKATTGKSAFGSYTGTAASGNSVTGLGFKPGFVMVKNITDSATEWMMFDNMRDPDADDVDTYLKANSSAAETTNNANVLFSFDSDGFTVDGAGNDTNGSGDTFIYMAFADGRDASFFHDESGQGNSFEPENLQNYDVVPDSPTNNFCTLNPLATSYITPPNYAEGNLEAIGVSNYHKTVFAGMGVTSGKWYFEGRAHGGNKFTIGLSDVGNMSYKQLSTTNAIIGYTPSGLYAHGDAVGVYARTLRKNGSTVASSMWNGYAAGDIMGIAFDADAGKVWFHQNGTWSNGSGTDSITLDPNNHDTTVTTGETYVPAFSMEGPAGWFVNFGQDDSFAGTVTPGGYTDANERGSFKYPVPDGFLSLCTANLPEPDISPANGQEPEDYFNTVLYTGNGYSTTNTQSITGVGFQSDWTWIKNRNGTGSHTVFDVVRGAGKSIRTDLTDTESTQTDSLTSFDSDGFSLGDNSESGAHVNVNNSTYVAWNWLAGGTASSNTDGSITSSVSANTKAGFSVVSYTGDGTASTIGHGLNSAPEMYIVKDRESGDNWVVYHKDLTSASYYLTLDTTNAQTSNNVVFNGTDPTSTVFSVGTSRSTNGNDFIAYCFHSVPGYSLVSSYTGNSSSDGVFVHCGFSPAFILGKSSSSAGDNWYIFDNKRDTENVAGKDLNPDSSAAEADSDLVDFLSNGFKWRASSGLVNDSTTFIFYAVAEMPFKYSTGR